MEHAHEVKLPEESVNLSTSSLWSKLAPIGLVIGVIGLGVSFALGWGSVRFYYAYLFAWVYFLTFALGGLFFVLVQHLTRAGWSVVVRRLAEHVMATLPVFLLLFLPIAFWHGDIYHWAHPEGDTLLEHKAPWLNSGFFLGRSLVYLAVFGVLAFVYARGSIRQDESGDTEITRRLQTRSALGMVLFALSLNFAAFDWVMSLDPHWFSTIFGVYMFAGCVVTILATLILLILQLKGGGYLQNIVTWEHCHDLGKLLFGFVVFWAYIGFSQFMLIWYGNIPEETSWFYHRWHDESWRTVSIALAAGHFAIPFLFLLFQWVKRQRWTLTLAALWLLVMHLVDVYWLVMPNLALVDESAHGFHPALIDLTSLLGVGGVFVFALGLQFKGRALVPLKDPRLAESLSFENA